jgi:hypothetical protein
MTKESMYIDRLIKERKRIRNRSIICMLFAFFCASIAFWVGYSINNPSFEKCTIYYDSCKIKMVSYNPNIYKFECENK